MERESDMTMYILKIEQHIGGASEVNVYSTATNAIDDFEGLRMEGAEIYAIFRDGVPIDKSTLRDDKVVGATIEAG